MLINYYQLIMLTLFTAGTLMLRKLRNQSREEKQQEKVHIARRQELLNYTALSSDSGTQIEICQQGKTQKL